jgi:hypothetical protein
MLLGGVVALLATGASAQERARYQDPPLEVTVPDGFEAYRADLAHPAVLGTFRRAPQGSRGPVVVQLLRLGAELPQRALHTDEREALRVGAPFRVDDRPMTVTAMGFTLPASVGRGRTPGEQDVLRVAAILPTRGYAVQVSVLVRASEEAEARAVLRAVLQSARGPVTWRTLWQRVFFGVATTAFALAVLGTLVIMVRVLLEARTTQLGPTAQRWIARATGLAWAVFTAWLLLPVETAEWAAAVPAAALALTFSARGWAAR